MFHTDNRRTWESARRLRGESTTVMQRLQFVFTWKRIGCCWSKFWQMRDVLCKLDRNGFTDLFNLVCAQLILKNLNSGWIKQKWCKWNPDWDSTKKQNHSTWLSTVSTASRLFASSGVLSKLKNISWWSKFIISFATIKWHKNSKHVVVYLLVLAGDWFPDPIKDTAKSANF